MTNRPITAADAQALLSGSVPSGQGDLHSLAGLVARVRSEAAAGEVTPSAALEAWFEAPVVSGAPDASAPVAAKPARRRLALVPGWIAGLGLVAKIALGSTVAAASVIGAGAAAVLPPAVQGVFDEVVTNVTSLDMQQVRDDWNGPTDESADVVPVPGGTTTDTKTPADGTPSVGRDGTPGKGTPSENPGKGTAPENPGKGTAPENPGKGPAPENPGKGTPPESPGKGTPPENPGKGTPGTPANPGNGAPGKPANPGNGNPGNPGNGAPGNGAPGNGNPGKGTPGTPANPGNGTPGTPANPGKPNTPATPQTPGNAGEAGSPVEPPGKGRP